MTSLLRVLTIVSIFLTTFFCTGCASFPSDYKTVTYISLAGKIVNSDKSEWLNDRLIVLFLKGKEVGRTTSTLQKTPPDALAVYGTQLTSNGIEDGIFYITGSNPYALNTRMLTSDTGRVFSRAGVQGATFETVAYTWLGELTEGTSVVLPIGSKNTRYVLKVLDGDISTLPREILRPYSLQLNANDAIVVTSAISTTAGLQGLTDSVDVDSLSFDPQSENEINKLTIPIDNCGGTSPVRQKYSQTQTYIKQINSEISAKVGIEIPLPIWIKIVAELQAKYGFEQGEIDSRTVEYEMGAEPRSKVVYVVTWKEVWDSGTAKLTTDQQGFSVPFRVRTNLVFQIDSQKIACP